MVHDSHPISNWMSDQSEAADSLIQDMLHGLRLALNMKVGFISEFAEQRRIFRYVDADEDFRPIDVGNDDPLSESYCAHIVQGTLPELMVDARLNPVANAISATKSLPVVSHLSVPIRFSQGEVFGTLCCFSNQVVHGLAERDLLLLRLFSDFLGKIIEPIVQRSREQLQIRERIQSVIDDERFVIHYQPIFRIRHQELVGYEALTRFIADPIRPPDQWLREAHAVHLNVELELAIIRRILADLHRFPSGIYVSINISPETIIMGDLENHFVDAPHRQIVLEVTEHVSVGDYDQIREVLDRLRSKGVRVAVDDAGSGYASFRHILKLKPDIIKMDSSLIQQIDKDPGCRAIAAAIVRFAEETNCSVVAEGVETESELAALLELNVDKAQGYLLGHPHPL